MSIDALRIEHHGRLKGVLAIAVSVMTISILHYLTSLHSVVLHEVLKRLYYVPIVAAAVIWGIRGGVATSLFATLLYMPHVILQWHAWAVLEAEQYGEVLMFNVIAIVAGVLADRLHAERALHRDAAVELRDAYAKLRAGNDERVRVDRLVTIGRIASGIAHEVRTPLAGLLGSLEILENEFTREHPKAEFVAIAKRPISRLQEVVTEFLEFAQPAPPAVRPVDLKQLVETTARLARLTLARRGVGLDAPATDASVVANVDAEQVQRALLGIMLADTPQLRDGHITIAITHREGAAQIAVDLEGLTSVPAISDLFEAFPTTGGGHGLALATAERLISNQHGAVKAEIINDGLRYLIDLPLAHPSLAANSQRRHHEREHAC